MAASYYALDKFLGIDGKDWSSYLLGRTDKYAASDTRIADRKGKRVLGTKPSIAIDKMVGEYTSDLCGTITIEENNGGLKLIFENHPLLSARLTHWHYDVWEIHWDHPQAWFGFGTLKLKTDNNLKVLGFDFDVPNDDFFFEELKPYKK